MRKKNHRGLYLKDIFIKDSRSKDSDALCVDDSSVTPAQWPGELLLTVHNEGHTFLLHTDGYTMPPTLFKQ